MSDNLIRSSGILRKHMDDPNQMLQKFNQDKQFISEMRDSTVSQSNLAAPSTEVLGTGGAGWGSSYYQKQQMKQQQQQPQPIIMSGAGEQEYDQSRGMPIQQEQYQQQQKQEPQVIYQQDQVSNLQQEQPVTQSTGVEAVGGAGIGSQMLPQQETTVFQQSTIISSQQPAPSSQDAIQQEEQRTSSYYPVTNTPQFQHQQPSDAILMKESVAQPVERLETFGIMSQDQQQQPILQQQSPFEQAKESSLNRQRIFGENELRGGRDHYFEDCVKPEQCPQHKEQFAELIRQPIISETWGQEEISTQSQGRQSLVEKLKQGLTELKDALLGKKEHLGEDMERPTHTKDIIAARFQEEEKVVEIKEEERPRERLEIREVIVKAAQSSSSSSSSSSSAKSKSSSSSSSVSSSEIRQQEQFDQLDDIGDEDIAQEEKIEKPASEIPYHRDIKGSGGLLEFQQQQQFSQQIQYKSVSSSAYSHRMESGTEGVIMEPILVQEISSFNIQEAPAPLYQQQVEVFQEQNNLNNLRQLNLQEVTNSQTLNTQMYQAPLQQNLYAETVDDRKLRTGEENAILAPAAGVTSAYTNVYALSLLSPQFVVQNQLYRSGGTLGTMNQGIMSQPTCIIEQPMTSTVTTGVIQQPTIVQEQVVQTVLVPIVEMQPAHVHTHAPRAKVINPKDIREADLYQENAELSRVQANTLGGMPLAAGTNVPVQDLGTPYGMGVRRPVHEHYSEHVHQADIMDAPHTHVLTTTDRMVGRAGDALGTLNTQPDALIHADPTTNIAASALGGAAYGAGIMGTMGTYGTTTTSYVDKTMMNQPTTCIINNPEIQTISSSYAAQHRVPNECHFCRDENDLFSHQEHISRGMYTIPTTTTTYVQEQVVSQPVQNNVLTDQKLPFGGTKPGQYMAQEVPVLYGWGAAPSQRIYKSNEVVGVNYSGATVAAKPHKLSRREKKELRQMEKDAYRQTNLNKLEQQYQGNINEQTAHTGNKVFRNVHEPIDSTITENKIH